MMKIVASLVIFGLCANICFAGNGVAVTASSNSGAFSSSVLNSSATKIISGTNTTDSAVWDSSSSTTPVAGVLNSYTWFGPGATNDTSYVYGVPTSGYTSATATTAVNSKAVSPTITTISSLRKRTINNTIVGWANDTVEASVVSDASISVSIMGTGSAGVGPGYLAWLTTGFDSSTAATTNAQVYLTLVSGTAGSASTSTLTKTADTFSSAATAAIPCTYTTYTAGNVWYDIGSAAFFYTYAKTLVTAATGSANTCGSFTSPASTVITVYLGGIYLNGTAYWSSPISVATTAGAVAALTAGGDNWLNASNIYIAFKDSTTSTTWYSKTTKAAATTAVASFSALIKDSTSGTTVATSATGGTDYTLTYSPVSVWSSNYTYGITLSNTTVSTVWSGTSGALTSTSTTAYTYANFLNGSTTGVDSGLSNSAASAAGGYWGWQLSTGYTVVASWSTGTTSPIPTAYTYATYYANGTANMTATTLGSTTYAGGAQFYEDVNGTQWIAWTDVDYANSIDGSYPTYNAYLAKFQGQLNVASGANILSVLSAFALFFAAIFAF